MVEEYNNVDFDDELYYVHSPCPTKTISEIHNCLTSVENATSSTDVPIREEIAARLCSHEHFHVIDLTNIAYALHKFSRNQKLVYLQAVLFCLSSPVGENNNLLKTEVTPTRRKRKIVQVNNIRSNTTTCFSLLGKGICLQSFAGVFGFSQLTVHRYAREVTNSKVPTLYENDKELGRKGKWGLRRIVTKCFLSNIAKDHGLECPRGRGSTDDSPIRVIPSYFTKMKINNEYKVQWKTYAKGAVEVLNLDMPEEPISYNLFVRYWSNDLPLLRVSTPGSDVWKTCNTLKNSISKWAIHDPVRIASKNELSKHIGEANSEFKLYKSNQEATKNGTDNFF